MLTIEEFTAATENGHIFSVEFTKRTTGELRKMVCRRGVAKYVKGVGRSFDADKKNLLSVYDMQIADEAKGYRLIPLDAIVSLRLNGTSYRWDCKADAFTVN